MKIFHRRPSIVTACFVLLMLITGIATSTRAREASLVQPAAEAVVAAQAAEHNNSAWHNPRRTGLYARQYAYLNGGSSSAVFAACSLHAGGIDRIYGVEACTVSSPDDETNNLISNWIEIVADFDLPPESGWSYLDITQFDELREGDLIMFINDQNQPCLGGVIGPSDSADLSITPITDHSQLNFYSHSISDPNDLPRFSRPLMTMRGGGGTCRNNVRVITHLYVRIAADITPPSVALADPYPPLNDAGGPIAISWLAADGESGVFTSTLQLFDGLNWVDSAIDFTTTQAAVELDMCSANRMRVLTSDQVGNISISNETTVRVYLQGDFDHDNIVGELDLAQLQRWIDGIEAAPLPNADLTGDGAVTIDDYLWLTLRLGEQCVFSN